MHLDGLADTSDGIGSRRPPDEALTIMKRSDIGPMGVATLVLVLLVDAAALASPHLTGSKLLAAVACLPMVGRVAVLTGTGRWAPNARPGGFGALFSGVTSGRGWALSTSGVLAVSVLAGDWASGLRGRGRLHCGAAAVLAGRVGHAVASDPPVRRPDRRPDGCAHRGHPAGVRGGSRRDRVMMEDRA